MRAKTKLGIVLLVAMCALTAGTAHAQRGWMFIQWPYAYCLERAEWIFLTEFEGRIYCYNFGGNHGYRVWRSHAAYVGSWHGTGYRTVNVEVTAEGLVTVNDGTMNEPTGTWSPDGLFVYDSWFKGVNFVSPTEAYYWHLLNHVRLYKY